MADFSSLVSSAAARGAYRSSQELAAPRLDHPVPGEPRTEGFAELVKQASSEAMATVREADATVQAGLRGEADTQKVVEATLALESTVRTAVSMRDKFVEAYQEILRMPI